MGVEINFLWLEILVILASKLVFCDISVCCICCDDCKYRKMCIYSYIWMFNASTGDSYVQRRV